jgi:hypothetical protein
MLQITLDRLMSGIADALRESVAPSLTDAFARSQAETAANLIDNLSTRVDWRSDILHAEVSRLEDLLQHAEELAPDGALPSITVMGSSSDRAESAPLVDRRVAGLSALAEVQDWLANLPASSSAEVQALAVDVHEFLLWQVEDQYARLRA